jgi:branched-chain amino acid transport system permease protein
MTEKKGAFWLTRLASLVAAIAFCLCIPLLGPVLGNFGYRILFLCGIYVTLSVSLNLINGITGQFSIGHAAFYMVGAYTGAILTRAFYESQPLDAIPWLLAMTFAGAAMAALTGLVVGLPSLRLKGDYLAIVTLGFGEIIRNIAINNPAVGGAYGLDFKPQIQAVWLVWLLAIVCIAVCRNLLQNAHGLPFLAVREDEVASSAMGVNTTNVKVTAFVIGAAFAGAAGSLLAHHEAFITPDMFKMEVSVMVLTMVVLGGSGSITGSVVAAIALIILPEWLRSLPNQVSLGHMLGAIAAIIAFVALCRKVQSSFHGTKMQSAGMYAGVTLGCIAAAPLLGLLLNLVPAMAAQKFEFSSLRMAIFAVILIVVMLLRPQGVFGQHEFSWDLFKRFKPRPSEASA